MDEENSPNQDFSPKPWLKMAGEPSRWHERFRRFCRMGSERSLLAFANRLRIEAGKKKKNTIPGSLSEAAKTWDWRKRAEAWDAEQARREDAKWVKRQEELREQEWDLSTKLLDKGKQMLQFPLAETTKEERPGTDGNPTLVTIFNPVRWTMRDAASLLKIGSEVGRLSSGMPTENTHTELTGPEGGPIEIRDIEAIRQKRWEKATDAMNRAIEPDPATEKPDA